MPSQKNFVVHRLREIIKYAGEKIFQHRSVKEEKHDRAREFVKSLGNSTQVYESREEYTKIKIINIQEKIDFWEIPAFLEMYNAVGNASAHLISPQLADKVLNNSLDTWRLFLDNKCYPLVTSAIVGYESPGVKFDRQIVYTYRDDRRVVLPTYDYVGVKNAVLFIPRITSHEIEKDGRDVVLKIPKNKVMLIANFPSRNGLYLPHYTTVPHGEEVDHSIFARFLHRVLDKYVGPITRCFMRNDYYTRSVDLDYIPQSIEAIAIEENTVKRI